MRTNLSLAFGLAAVLWCQPNAQALAGATTRVSVGSSGVQANGASTGAAISADGRTVVFLSDASNLVASDRNGASDVFTRNRQLGRTASVGSAPGGSAPFINRNNGPSISADGRYVAFFTVASLVPSDRGDSDIYVRDRKLGTFKWASVGVGGAQPNGPSFPGASMSANGRYVAFSSLSFNLVSGLNVHSRQIYVRDLRTNTTKCVSVKPDGIPSAGGSLGFETAISADGRYVVFTGVAADLVPGDTNGVNDVFVRDMKNRVTVRASLGNRGVQANNASSTGVRPGISANGRFVVFSSFASDLVAADASANPDIYVRDLRLGTTSLANLGPGNRPSPFGANNPAISSNGRFVVFESVAPDLVSGDHNLRPDIFIRDRQLRTTRLVSVTNNGGEANGASSVASISADGSLISFYSTATNLVAGDTNGAGDIFVRKR